MQISIITPVLDQNQFAPAYWEAVNGADQVIIVDTGSQRPPPKEIAPGVVRPALTAEPWAWETGASVIVNYSVRGHNYGHWCNAGYQEAVGDIVIFLNNDVRAEGDWLSEVAASVQPGSLYGPELSAQTVAGVTVPFLSGWCIAATRETWQQLILPLPGYELGPYDLDDADPWSLDGPWDTLSYPSAGYWEDNDLSFRAVMERIELVQTKWPITHLDGGNGTSKHKKDYYADVARNRATFERMVRAAMLPGGAMEQRAERVIAEYKAGVPHAS